jgi:hypothetical protein
MTMHSDHHPRDITREAWKETLVSLAALAALAVIVLLVFNL